MAHRPRASILSLFDPLSVSAISDKENDIGEMSFLHAHASQTPVQRTLRRRLIDVGDMTVDEPDMHDLLAIENELEEINRNITDNDDGDTLTWRDMAKAATPKWSGRHATSIATPKASPTPRTPLGELSFTDETTPMARKKSYRRHILPAPSKVASVESPPSSPLAVDFALADKFHKASRNIHTPSASASDITTPTIEISDTDAGTPPQSALCAPDALSSSVYTLDLSAHSENLIADSSLPLDISPSSSQSSQSPNALLPLPLSQVRLRPHTDTPSNAGNRMSVDLQSSFQLHLSSSDTTFDLLNEKISFFSSKSETDSFLNNIDSSFGEEDLNLISSHHLDLPNIAKVKPTETNRVFIPSSEYHTAAKNATPVSSPNMRRLSGDSHDFLPRPSPKDDAKSLLISNTFSLKEQEPTVLSTPSTSKYPTLPNPPPPVPGLKIVKRSKLLSRRLSTVSNANSVISSGTGGNSTHSRRISDTAPTNILVGRAKSTANILSSPTDNSSRITKVSQPAATRKGTLSSTSHSLSGDGPRRVLVSEGPKLMTVPSSKPVGSADTARAPLTANGPRRIAANSLTNGADKAVAGIKSAVSSQSNTGLRQPVKYGTVGSSSAIPKPVSRTAGSRLPAPAIGTTRSRFGIPNATSNALTREVHVRRVT